MWTMAHPKQPGRGPATVIRNVPRPVRDLENPTAQFPIGAMYRRKQEESRTGPTDEPEDDTELLDWDDPRHEEDDDEFSEPVRRRGFDMWVFALWLVAAAVLGLLAAAVATAAVLYV
jgi:hypothetical protein